MDLSLPSATSSTLSSSSSSSTSNTSWFSFRGRFDKSASVKMSNNSAHAGGGGVIDNVGPVVRKNQFRGVLFKYGPDPIQVAFKTGDYKQ